MDINNKIIFLIATIVLLILQSFQVVSQNSITDTTFQLKEIVVTENRVKNFFAGIKIHQIDSNDLKRYAFNNLADLLANDNSLFVKSYGAGSLATTSFRGGSANHTAILWNGFNLNSPMNGQLDLALVPNNFVNKVSIRYGGGSALWGSGAV